MEIARFARTDVRVIINSSRPRSSAAASRLLVFSIRLLGSRSSRKHASNTPYVAPQNGLNEWCVRRDS